MKLLRKGDKCKLEATNYRPISLLSVFYKIAFGAITRRLERVIDKVIGRNQKAYSSKKKHYQCTPECDQHDPFNKIGKKISTDSRY